MSWYHTCFWNTTPSAPSSDVLACPQIDKRIVRHIFNLHWQPAHNLEWRLYSRRNVHITFRNYAPDASWTDTKLSTNRGRIGLDCIEHALLKHLECSYRSHELWEVWSFKSGSPSDKIFRLVYTPACLLYHFTRLSSDGLLNRQAHGIWEEGCGFLWMLWWMRSCLLKSKRSHKQITRK